MNTIIHDQLNNLFDELVPMSGKADSLAGEIVRATSRIGYRFFNDGDQIGIGYGKETCNAAARFLIRYAGREIGDQVARLWGLRDGDKYESILDDDLIPAVVAYIADHPALREVPTIDMYDCYDKDEDVDDSWDEEDEEDCW